MAEAIEAVEAEERADQAVEDMLEVGDDEEEEEEIVAGGDKPPAPPEPGAPANDVTSALLNAKHELEEVLAQTQKEAKNLHEKWIRAAADLENYRKRATRERDDIVKFGNERLLNEFLPVLDDLERTVESVAGAGDDASVESLLEGVRMVVKKFLGNLEKHGVTSFDSAGQPFDPAQHEAVQQLHSDDAPAGTVAEELRRGFLLNGRLLRPAMVAVSLGAEGGAKKAAAEEPEENAERDEAPTESDGEDGGTE